MANENAKKLSDREKAQLPVSYLQAEQIIALLERIAKYLKA